MLGLQARLRRPRDGDEDGGHKKKFRQASDRPVTQALEKKRSKMDMALGRVADRHGTSERFELEQAYRDAMDPERDTGRIVSFGRKNPVFPQGAIVRSVKQDPRAWERRGERMPDFKRVVPLGGKNTFDIQPGEVSFQMFYHRVPNPKVKQGDTSITVSTTVNGLGPRDKAQFAGISTTANRVSTPDGDNRSNNLMAGLATVVHTGHQVIPFGATVLFTLTPYAVKGDTPSSMVPAIDEKGQPEDKFRVALHPLDERVVSAMLLRCRMRVDKAIGDWVGRNDASDPDAMKNRLWSVVAKLAEDELRGFELFPDDKPSAAYITWYGIRRILILAIEKNLSFVGCGAADAIKEARAKFRISREDDDFVAAHGGSIDMSEEGKLMRVLNGEGEYANKSAATTYFVHGIDRLIEARIDHAVQGQHCLLRRTVVGISMNWCNPGSELDLLVGMGGNTMFLRVRVSRVCLQVIDRAPLSDA